MAFGLDLPVVDELIGYLGGLHTDAMQVKRTQQANEQQLKLLAEQNAYNSAEAQKQRDWEAEMSNTAYQRARADMEKAGINPIYMANGGQVASTPVGSSASSAASHAAHVAPTINIMQAGLDNRYKSTAAQNDTINTAMNVFGKIAGAAG